MFLGTGTMVVCLKHVGITVTRIMFSVFINPIELITQPETQNLSETGWNESDGGPATIVRNVYLESSGHNTMYKGLYTAHFVINVLPPPLRYNGNIVHKPSHIVCHL